MKQVPADLTTYDVRTDPGGGQTHRFVGRTASLEVRAPAEGVFEFTYEFTRFPVDPRVGEAANLLYDENRDQPVAPELPRARRIAGAYKTAQWELPTEDITITVDEATGVIGVYRGEQRIHGGAIGSPDTVLPRYPLRVHGTPPLHVQGTFNFKLDPQDRFYGLGDKSGGPDRRGRRFLMHNRDALGYRASFADPLYKSIPFLLRYDPIAGSWSGLAVPAPGVTTVDLGVESELYYSISLRNGPYRYVLFLGDSYLDVLDRYTWLTGRPALPPAFSFGFLGSSMDYTEPHDAPQRVMRYINTVEELDIPCEGLYLSSGYYKSDDGYRHTFEWNTRKFHDPAAFIGEIRARGYHIACNVKPGILTSHPRYETFVDSGYLIENADRSAYTEYYWGGDASFWDFSRENALAQWRYDLRERLLDLGVDGVWNDNNEYEIEDSSVPASSTRSTMALRMCRASFEEMLERDRERRPWVITRSGGMGIQRYARTWSGDNVSSWESLRYNTLMSVSFGVSGLPFFGHDVGGFYGPRPEAEQFLRWCQAAVFQPRFVVHSWKGEGEQTELWSYGELTPVLRSLVLEHYEFMPYTYSLAYEAHRRGTPLHRSPAIEYPRDKALSVESASYLYGPYLLVTPVVEPGTDRSVVRLPRDDDWYDPRDGRRYCGGENVEIAMPLSGDAAGRMPYLVRAGAIVPRAPGVRSLQRGWFESLVIDLYPGRDTRFSLFEDDGFSRLELGRWSLCELVVEAADSDGRFRFRSFRTDQNSWIAGGNGRENGITLTLPPGFVFVEPDPGDSRRRTYHRTELLTGLSLDIHVERES